MSFMNLATSIKTYYDNSVEFDDKTRNFKQKISEINYSLFLISILLKIMLGKNFMRGNYSFGLTFYIIKIGGDYS